MYSAIVEKVTLISNDNRYSVFSFSYSSVFSLLAFGMSFNGYTYFVNATMCTRSYNPSNDFIVFDVPMPNNASKSLPNINYFTGVI